MVKKILLEEFKTFECAVVNPSSIIGGMNCPTKQATDPGDTQSGGGADDCHSDDVKEDCARVGGEGDLY